MDAGHLQLQKRWKARGQWQVCLGAAICKFALTGSMQVMIALGTSLCSRFLTANQNLEDAVEALLTLYNKFARVGLLH